MTNARFVNKNPPGVHHRLMNGRARGQGKKLSRDF